MATLVNGRAYAQPELLDAGTPVLRIQNLNGGDRWYFSDLDLPDDKYCEKDDLLYAWSATFGPYWWTGPKCIYHYHIWKILTGTALDKRYAFHMLGWLSAIVKASAHGVTMVHMTKSGMEDCRVPLPPLPEQKRIAAILDKADAIRRKRQEAIRLTEELLRSAFLDMFGDPVTNPKGWEVKKLGEVCVFFAGNSLPAGMAFSGQTGGVLLLKVGDMNTPGNEVAISAAREWSGEVARGAIVAPKGAVVIPKRGGAIGTNKKRVLLRPAALDPNLMAIAPSSALSLEYLRQWFEGIDLSSLSSGSAVPQLNKKDLDPLLIPVPPLRAQKDFCRIHAVLAARAEHTNAAEALATVLQTSLTQRAFSGRL